MQLSDPIREKIDLSQKYDKIFFVAQQYEKDARILEIELTHNRKPYTIPGGVDVYIQVDDRIYNKCTVTNNIISIKFTQAMCAIDGTIPAKLILINETGVLYSTLFHYRVEGGLVDPTTIIPTEEITGILEILAEVRKSINDCTDATETCIEETEKTIEEQKKIIALNNQITDEEQIRITNENHRISAEEQRITNENNRVLAETSRVEADENRTTNTQNALNAINTTKSEVESLMEQMQNLINSFNSLENGMLSKVYPVGSIYTSENPANPQTLFGGTWESYGSGKVLIGVDPDDPDFNMAGSTGGAKTIDLSHSHTVNEHTHEIGEHTHGLNEHTHNVGAHVHSLNGHTHTIAHTHNVPAHKHSGTFGYDANNWYINEANGTVTIGASGEIDTGGAQKGYAVNFNSYSATTPVRAGYTSTQPKTATEGASKSTSGTSSGNTGSSSAFDTGEASGNTANSTAFNSGNASPGTDTKLTSDQSIVQSYITVYRWKRIA